MPRIPFAALAALSLAAAVAPATLAAGVGPAKYVCNEPYAPIVALPPDATLDQLRELKLDVVAFLATSDMYQDCLYRNLEADKEADERQRRLVFEEIESNQREKERVGKQFNAIADRMTGNTTAPAPATTP